MNALTCIVCLWLLVLLPASSTFAHDIGIIEATFTTLPQVEKVEEAPYRYRLSIENPVKEMSLLRPMLPGHCDFAASQTSGTASLVLDFSCRSKPLFRGEAIIFPWRSAAALVTVKKEHQPPIQTLFLHDGEVITIHLSDFSSRGTSLLARAKRYFFLGCEHILTGIDHLLFVLGILLLIRNSRVLIQAITAFTVAHSITLALSFLGVLFLPSAPVEVCIAFSIVILAYEAIRAVNGEQGLTARRPWLVAGGFGLLHGLGFAGALSDLSVPSTDIPVALLFFNLGVEAGQMLFVLAVLACVFIITRLYKPLTSHALRTPVAYSVGCVAMYWALERSAFMWAGV